VGKSKHFHSRQKAAHKLIRCRFTCNFMQRQPEIILLFVTPLSLSKCLAEARWKNRRSPAFTENKNAGGDLNDIAVPQNCGMDFSRFQKNPVLAVIVADHKIRAAQIQNRVPARRAPRRYFDFGIFRAADDTNTQT
jgi:hypothetical protein